MVFWKTPRRCSKESNFANRIIPQSAFLRARVHRTVIEVLHPVALCQLWRWQLHHLSMGQDSVREPYIILIYFEGYFQYVFVCVCLVIVLLSIFDFLLAIDHRKFWSRSPPWRPRILRRWSSSAWHVSWGLCLWGSCLHLGGQPGRTEDGTSTSTPLENGDWDGLDLGKEKVQFGFSMSRIFDWCRVFP